MEEAIAQNEEELQLVVFALAKEEYGLPITKVQEINRMAPITALPQTPSFVEGVINLRGRIIPVIDLRKRFQLPVLAQTDDTRIIIVDMDGQTIGVVVDGVNEVVRLSSAQVEPAPPSFMLDSKYICGVGKLDKRMLILLNMDKVITEQEAIALREV